MRIAVVGTSRSGSDPITVRLVESLADAGHDVTFLSAGAVDGRIDAAADEVISVDTRWPLEGGRVAALGRRLNPTAMRHRNRRKRIVTILRTVQPDLVYGANEELTQLADAQGFTVASDTRLQGGASNDLVRLAPTRPLLAGLAPGHWTAWVDRPLTVPSDGRYSGKRIVLCYHPTATTPARYLHAALERAGVRVETLYPTIDLGQIADDTDGVVFVESPYPELEVVGNTTVPILYWVHHGEIHLYQNLRLAQRYRADAVLLAHSWHLAHRFKAPVFMFPFGVPIEMLREDMPFAARPFEVSMIAAGFDSTDRRYAARREAAAVLGNEYGEDRVRFAGGVTPREVFATYAKSKVVIDEGGALHKPITMRVFEATGSGAALLTEPAPGIDLLFDPEREYAPLDVVTPLGSVLDEERNSRIARAGRQRALGAHTYDHRVDDLMSILGVFDQPSTPKVSGYQSLGAIEATPGSIDPLSRAVGRFAEIDSIACGEAGREVFAMSTYLVRSHDDVAASDRRVDALICSDSEEPTFALLRCAHRYVFCTAPIASTVRTMLATTDRRAIETTSDGIHVFDFETPGYIVRDAP